MNIKRHSKCLFLILTPLALSLTLLSAVPAKAQYSDHYYNKKQAEASRNRALKYGGTYSHAAQTYMNRRYGYLRGGGDGYYSPHIIPTRPRSNRSSRVEHLPEHQELVDKVDRYLQRYGM
ncbi:MAG: hypothetical protein QNJ41_16130 [Xenococcaceae cyanobacterium MO_188.B32]|nr:hypothetical protein [Xenococcaceae cyanobacterium MO_188.B32]